MALHLKHWDWKQTFDFFKQHPIAMGTFATKYVNPKLLDYNPEGKIRIRFSLMPQEYSTILEPKTSTILERIQAINTFIEAGYDVHVNFSPIIVHDKWLEYYEKLFMLLDQHVKYKDVVKAEVIFLTHNINKHHYNIENKIPGEDLLWQTHLQESKTSQHGGINIRYKHKLKAEFISMWTNVYNQTLKWCEIRYIF